MYFCTFDNYKHHNISTSPIFHNITSHEENFLIFVKNIKSSRKNYIIHKQ
ncbi:hypothetical protein NLO413_0032 [Candidatus Neoehrlichia lotoris str. RAC413]|uniref:Uncharacterized protein n=1 Tax=Candidatus Neoehrlichia procyonis str. RAC413 TaxID=1359163 RepID=A0A0F3NLV4_9RICK|nr:hypothetical protein NLO413_0032 [Candidatus Neoehrlichia lotoris str. RAC413]